jgi:large repetitive protein
MSDQRVGRKNPPALRAVFVGRNSRPSCFVRLRLRRASFLLTPATAALLVLVLNVSGAAAASACPSGGCAVTIDARDFASGNPLASFSFVVNLDNTKLPSDPNALSTESNSPIVAEGSNDHNTVHLTAGRFLVSARSLDHKMWGKYLTLPDDADSSGNLTVPIDLTEQSEDHPLPLGKIRVFVFNDNAWTNGAPDTEEAGLNGFKVELKEQTDSAVTVDYNNDPLCGGVCHTAGAGANAGFVEINNLGPATYFIDVHAPDSCDPNNPSAPSGPGQWYQTTTIDGGLSLIAPTEEGADGTGAPGEQLWEPPNNRTAYWFGFVCGPRPFSSPGTGEITGTARNWVEWAPYTVGTFNDPVEEPLVALSDASTDQTVYVGRGDQAGNIDIQNVPAGDYNLSVWDEQLSYIMRFKPVHVDAGQTVNLDETGDDGSAGLGVSRWFGWLDGTVYKDLNGDGQFDAGDVPLGNTDMDQRWRDGSIKESTVTDPSGHYEYPTAEGGALGRWFINEQGFARFSAFPGASAHDERTGDVTPSCVVVPPKVPANPCVPNSQGGGLLVNQSVLEGHRTTVDWGKRDYPAGTPGQIVGITYFATTRNEFDARFQAHEDYEAAIPDVTVYLEQSGPDGVANTSDDVIVNKYVTDHWQQPNANQDPQPDGNQFTQNCNPLLDFSGNDITGQLAPDLGPKCLEVPLTGAHTKEGAFDGGYAFATYCPNGYDLAADDGTCTGGTDPVDLVAGDYIVHAVMPTDIGDTRPCNPPDNGSGFKNLSGSFGDGPDPQTGCLYRIVKEEDVNVDLGNQFTTQIPPPPCNGDDHVIDKSTLTTRSNFFNVPGAHAPLCDKHLVVLQNGQNANADFFLMTNFRTDPNGKDASETRTGDVEEPGRVVGQVFNDIYFDRNQSSHWYGEPRPIADIPIGIYARVDIANNADNCGVHDGSTCITSNKGASNEVTYDQNRWRLIKTIKTGADGTYEILLPSTETLNCPIPQGPCPGMYIAIVDDPGSKAHPNSTYNPNLLTANTPFEVWPGLTTQLDTPIDPISGTACEDPAGGTTPDPSDPARPDLLQVSRPYVNAADAGTARRITIQSDFIGTTGAATGATGVRATLTDARNGEVETLTRANGGIVSWTPGTGSNPDTVVVQVPALASNAAANLAPNATFRPGPKQLTITTANANGGVSSVNGLTLHVLGTNGTTSGNVVTYNPPIVNVGAPSNTTPVLQNAINAAAAGSLLVLSPGTYNENVLVWKPLKLQGLGPGGIVGAHELQGRDPEDPRFNILGSVIDGRFFQQNFGTFDATAAAHPGVLPPFTNGNPSVVLRGADITVNAASTSAYDLGSTGIFNAARIDGLGLVNGHGDGAGGVQLQASVNNMQMTNNVLENNGGLFAGGIGLGQLYVHDSHNYNVKVANDRVIGNGGLTTSGGVGVFYGSNNYEVANSVLCSNFSVEYGAGLSHIGLSPGGSIHDNRVYYNEAVDSGGGIAIESELPVGAASLGAGSGSVNVDRNLIQSNASVLDDGGGIFVLDSLDAQINVRNNMIVDNLAADIGGAIMLDDASKVSIANNTVANNVTTGSSENSAIGVPHSAGLASEANDPLWQSDSRYTAQYPSAATRPDFSNPLALFNNIFWNNDAQTLSQFGPGATLVDQGFIDFEIHGTTNTADTFTPRWSILTNGQLLGPDGSQRAVPGSQGNQIGADPGFVTPFTLELAVGGARLDPQQAAVTITGADPPIGLTGDYHITAGSPAIDRGAGFSNLPFAGGALLAPAGQQTPNASSILAPCSGTGTQNLPADFDGQWRPQERTLRVRTPWDVGADELAGLARPVPSLGATPMFNWNNAGHPQCSGSTVP